MIMPVGDVLMWGVYKSVEHTPAYVYKATNGYEHLAQSANWWVSPAGVTALRKIVLDFDGFSLGVGEIGKGTPDTPEVIETEIQERKNGRPHTTNTRGDEALVGYTLVWLDIDDTELAYHTLSIRTDIPVAPRCDVTRWNTDARYREVFDLVNEAFMYYFIHGKSLNVASVSGIDDDERINKMYNV